MEPDVARSSQCVIDTFKPLEPVMQSYEEGIKNSTETMNDDTNAIYWEQMYVMMKYLSSKCQAGIKILDSL